MTSITIDLDTSLAPFEIEELNEKLVTYANKWIKSSKNENKKCEVSPAFLEKIERARKDRAEGKCIRVTSTEELNKFLDSL